MRRPLVPTGPCSLLAAVLALCSTTPAAAQQTIAPPGNSGVEQYLETIPTAAGNAAPTPRGRRTLPAPVRRRLAEKGNDGRQLAQLVEVTSPSHSGRRHRRRSARPAARPVEQAHPPLRSAADALSAGSGSGGMGIVLPVLLVGSVAVITGIALRKRRA